MNQATPASWIPIVVSAFALLGVLGTAVFAFMGQRQNRKSNEDTTASTMARAEIEQALSSQRDRLNQIHDDYRKEIDAILASHAREIAALRAQYESQINELLNQVGELRARAERAERRADRAEEQAHASAGHAERCDAALSKLQGEYKTLRAQVEEMKP